MPAAEPDRALPPAAGGEPQAGRDPAPARPQHGGGDPPDAAAAERAAGRAARALRPQHRGHRGLSRRRRERPRAQPGEEIPGPGAAGGGDPPPVRARRAGGRRSSPAWGWCARPPRPTRGPRTGGRPPTAGRPCQEPARAAEAYRKAGKLRDAARCFAAAGQPLQAAELYIRAGDSRVGRRDPRADAGDLPAAVALYLEAGDLEQATATLRRIPAREPGYLAGALLLAPKLVEGGRPEEKPCRSSARRRPPVPTQAREETGNLLDRLYWEGARARGGSIRPRRRAKRYEKVLELDTVRYRDAAERLGRLEAPPEPAPPRVRALAARSPDGLATGQRLANRYEILGELGRAGMGRVYKAQDLDLGEMVAIKTLLTPAEGAAGDDEERLLREVQICRRVSHPNVVRVFDARASSKRVRFSNELSQPLAPDGCGNGTAMATAELEPRADAAGESPDARTTA